MAGALGVRQAEAAAARKASGKQRLRGAAGLRAQEPACAARQRPAAGGAPRRAVRGQPRGAWEACRSRGSCEWRLRLAEEATALRHRRPRRGRRRRCSSGATVAARAMGAASAGATAAAQPGRRGSVAATASGRGGGVVGKAVAQELALCLGCHVSAMWRLTAENRRHVSQKPSKTTTGAKVAWYWKLGCPLYLVS